MNINVLKPIKLISEKWNFSDFIYQLFLLFLGIITLFFIILIKSKTATEFLADPLIFFYTIFVTTFQLSRVVGAMFYKHSASKILSEVDGGGIMSR